jgi:hypothetical protein
MNQQQIDTPRAVSELDRFGAWTGRILFPTGGRPGLSTARRAVGVLTVVGTLVQIVVWLLVAVFSRDLDTPWWLYYAAGGAAAIGSLWIVDEFGLRRDDSRGGDR